MKAKLFLLFFGLLGFVVQAVAKEKIYVNSEVTTHIVMPENIKLVDISTTKIMGNQCADNMVRIKPYLEQDSIKASFDENELLGTITLIGERHIASVTDAGLYPLSQHGSLHLSKWPTAIPSPISTPKCRCPRLNGTLCVGSVWQQTQVQSGGVDAHGMKAIVNNIYTIGDYFFIDYSLQNKTKIAYDIEELRVKLTDKKETKATNSQTIELTPVYSLNPVKKFKKNYRNVLVIEKLTFPDEKVLRLEISENQISGRVIALTIEYEDILNADGFDSDILKNSSCYPYYYIYR